MGLAVFPNAEVVGIDVERGAMLSGIQRLRTYLANSLNKSRIEAVLSGNEFDMILDDGLHTPLGQLATLRGVWPFLRIGGTYVIEDVDANFKFTTSMAAHMGAVLVNTGSDF